MSDATTIPATLKAMTDFIVERLVKPVSIGADHFNALSETAERFNETSWFWTDDNAKAAELLCSPETYDRDPVPGDAAIDFILRMSPGDIIQRRCGQPELRVVAADPQAFRIETAFFIVEGDLSKGVVRQSLRFNDGRTIVAAQHTGNTLRFRHIGRATTMDVEDAIDQFALEETPGRVTMWHSSAVTVATGLLRRAPKVLGHLRYSYTIDMDRQAIATSVDLTTQPGVTLDDVTLSTALDQLSKSVGVDYRCVALRAQGANHTMDRVTDGRKTLHSGPAEYVGISQVGASPGFSYGIHVLVRDSARLSAVVANGQKAGMLHWVALSYVIGRVEPGATVSVAEERMLTGGGYYDALEHYETVLRAGLGGGYDPSMTYDIGAELNAVAAQIVLAAHGCYANPPSPERLATLTAWYDRHLQRYFDFIRPGSADDLARVFTRGIGYVVLSLDCMLRATGAAHYRERMDVAVGLILRMGRRLPCGRDEHDLTFGDVWSSHVPFLDNHAACLLALSRAIYHGDPSGALARAIGEAVLGIKLHTGVITLNPQHTIAADSLATIDCGTDRHADTGFWNFKLGVVLRAMHVIERAVTAGVLTLDPLVQRRVALRRDLCIELLGMSMRWHQTADGSPIMEVLTSRIAGETNSETQPWVALGLDATIDDLIVTLTPPLGTDAHV